MVAKALGIPVIAAGGIGSGEAMLAAFTLGAEGVQIGSRFAASVESSAHNKFKKSIVESEEGDTILTMKKLTPVRLLKNDFYKKIYEAENKGATKEKLSEILGKRRAKLGIFEGDLSLGKLEIGQVSANISTIQPARKILEEIWTEFTKGREKLCAAKL